MKYNDDYENTVGGNAFIFKGTYKVIIPLVQSMISFEYNKAI
jgi:hypothetical protein